MSSVIFSNAQRIISQVLNWFQTSQQTRTSQLIQDAFQAGIDNATSLGEGFTIVPGSNNTPSAPSINITAGGIAYDVNGNRIFISTSDTTLYNASNPSSTTNDGTGNFVSTPQSTGVINVPVAQTSLNYVWADYLPAIDTSAFTLGKIAPFPKLFYKQVDGYVITVTTTNVPPDAGSVFLGTVNQLGGGAVITANISQTGRQYFNILPQIIPITTPQANRSDATVTYAPANSYDLEAHIKAVGTSPSGVSPTNPHALTLSDLGVSTLDTVVGHRQLEHGNAIVMFFGSNPATPFPSTSAMATSINIVNPGTDYLTVFQLLSTEFALINGTAYNVTEIFGAIPTNATIFFPNVSGVYNVYWDSIVKAFSSTTSDISGDNTKLWIATVSYSFVGTGPSDHNALSSLIDRRRIGSSTHLLQRWLTNSRPGVGATIPNSGEFGFNLTTNLLEYWDGTQWQQPINSSSNSTVPSGAMMPFAGASAPTGWLLANGAAVSRTTFANLFAAIGTTWGAGDGVTTFNLPNMVNAAPIGAGSIASLGTTAGATTASNTHNHTMSHQHLTNTGHLGATGYMADPSPYGVASHSSAFFEFGMVGEAPQTLNYDLTSDSQTADTGSTTISVSTIQPSAGVTYIIKS